MTVPQERFRAIRWAREFLQQVAQNALMPVEVRTNASALLALYPTDRQLRALIDSKASGLPAEVADPLSAASSFIFAFRQHTDMTMLAAVRRHLPTSEEIERKLALASPGLISELTFAGVHHWLEPDEDYVQAVVKGWLEDYPAAVAVKSGQSQDTSTLSEPWYLITATTSGVNYRDLQVGQRVVCTVARPWHGEESNLRHVTSCEIPGVGTL